MQVAIDGITYVSSISIAPVCPKQTPTLPPARIHARRRTPLIFHRIGEE